MGRPEQPLDGARPALRALAERLRVQRAQAELTLDELARRCPVSKATLSRAANGRSLPALRTVEAWGSACAVHEREAEIARHLWLRARRAVKGTGHRVDLDLVHDFNDLRQAMLTLRARAGSPSLREVAHLAGEHARLSRTTVRDILRGARRPRIEQLYAFVGACGITDAQMNAWGSAWERAAEAYSGRSAKYGYAVPAPTRAVSPRNGRVLGQQRGPTWEDLEEIAREDSPRGRRMAVSLQRASRRAAVRPQEERRGCGAG